MHNCIFTAHCTELMCDRSCPKFVETTYLLERNGITFTSPVFSDMSVNTDELSEFLDNSGTFASYIVSSSGSNGLTDTIRAAEFLTYVAICKNYQGSRLHCTVYNLKYSKYLDELKKSWSMKSEPESLEYAKIWSESAKVLIISNIDYVNFGDFEAQTLLNLIQSRQSEDKTTIVVSPPVSTIKGKSVFLSTLTSKIASGAKKAVSR